MSLITGVFVFFSTSLINAASPGNPIKDCPEMPNCVSTRALSQKNRIQPIIFNGQKFEFKNLATAVIQSMPSSKIILSTENYIHAEFTSSMMKFVDDFELFYDEDKKMIDMRSAARVGYYDFDVNLKRSKEFEIGFLNRTKK